MKKQWMFCLASMLIGSLLLLGVPTDADAAENHQIASADEWDESETGTKLPEGFAGENLYKPEELMGMDEEGNIFVLREPRMTYDTMIVDTKANEPAVGDYFVNFRTKSNYDITTYVEAGTGNEGYVCGKYGADAIYLGMVNGQVKFMMAGVIGVVNADEVELIHKDDVQSFSYYQVIENGNLIHRITSNMRLSSYGTNLNNGPAPEYLKTGVEYYSYDGHYFYDDFDSMIADYQTGFRDRAVNPDEPFFNYFQFLPIRSYSEFSGEELTEMINQSPSMTDTSKMKNLGKVFVEMQNNYGVNALLAASVAANESYWGTSDIAKTKNNLFGINAVDKTPGQSANYYKTPEICVKEFTEHWMSKVYCNPNKWNYRGTFLGNKASGINLNYASDPYWGEKVAALAWILDGYGVRSYDKTDAYVYTLGVKDANSSDHTNMNIRREPDSSSVRLYRTKTQPGHAFIILDKEPVNGYYKIQSEPVLNYSRTAIGDTGAYSKYSMYAYGLSECITIVSEGTKEDVNKVYFKDVPEDIWFYPSVEYVVENGIMAGFTYDTFGPYSNLARSQFPVLLYRLEGEPEVKYTKKFKDVPEGTWYTDAILWASENNIVSGYTNGYYGVNDSITREQMAVMMHRYAEYKEYYVGDIATIKNFDDIKKVSDYAEDALRWAVGSELLYGKENGTLLDPQGVANRSEGAAVFMRFMNYYR